ncbi:MAG: flavin reductase family protein [Bacteroides sp.]|nr:flavin reductase family protein [Bacteroides sp.]
MENKKYNLIPIKATEISDNPIELFSKDFAVIAAGNREKFNELLVSWGALGTSWGNGLPLAIVFVSPDRYTHEFIERCPTFSINIFPPELKKDIMFFGTHTGRDIDKVACTGLVTDFTESGTPVFPQARLILECKKLYSHNLDKTRFSQILTDCYNNPILKGQTPHTVYFAEIINCWEKEKNK